MRTKNDTKNSRSQSAILALDNQGFARVGLERSESSLRIETKSLSAKTAESPSVRTIGILIED